MKGTRGIARVLIALGLLALALLAISGSATPALAVGPHVWLVNGAYASDSGCGSPSYHCKTVQAAAAGALDGDTVVVAPGTYNVSQISISKAINLVGGGAGTTIIDGGSATLTNAGMLRITHVTTGPVVVKGFTFQNAGADSAGTIGLIVVDHNSTSSPVTIRDNHFVGRNNGDLWDMGLWLYSGDGAIVIQNNEFEKMWQGILLERPRGGGSVLSNSFHNLLPALDSGTLYEAEGLFAFTYDTDDVTQSLAVNSNTFSDFNGASIAIGGGYPGHTARHFTNVEIRSNVITALGPGPERRRDGIYLINYGATAAGSVGGGVVNAIITGNRISGTTTTADSNGIWLSGPNNNATIQGNVITGVKIGIRVDEKYAGAGYSSGVHAQYNSIYGNDTGVDNGGNPDAVLATNVWWGSSAGPGAGGNNGTNGLVTTDPFAAALVSSTAHSTHELGETGSLDTSLTVNGLYGVQFVVNYLTSVLSWDSGLKVDSGAGANDWIWAQTYPGKDFADSFPAAGQTELAASLRNDSHPAVANLTDAKIATWTYDCAFVGSSPLAYDTTSGIGTYLSDRDGFVIPAAFTGDSITCVAASGSVDGTIALQGRVQGATSPAGWNGAVVILACADSVGGCAGNGPYVLTTDNTGAYSLAKTGAGNGIVAGNYSVSVTRRAYLGASKTGTISVAKDGTTTVTGPVPPLLGGDVDDSGAIDISDLSTIGTAFGQVPVGGADTGADVNGDDIVNIFDLVLGGGNFNLTTSNWP